MDTLYRLYCAHGHTHRTPVTLYTIQYKPDTPNRHHTKPTYNEDVLDEGKGPVTTRLSVDKSVVKADQCRRPVQKL